MTILANGAAAAPATASPSARFADDVREHLTRTPRQLPTQYLYDALGSALFDAICELPWYPLTRAEKQLLAANGASVLETMQPLARVIELGAGNGSKLAALLSSAPRARPIDVHLIDVSRDALRTAAAALSQVAANVHLHEASYEAGLGGIGIDAAAGRSLALFLGSNIGNFDPADAVALLRRIRASLRPGDGLLLGADLVKPEAQLLLAYDDPLQVTAAFNRNLLVRIDRELDADFMVERFAHRAVWNALESRVEMHLVSACAQRVTIGAADLTIDFAEGETIWTESSYKYHRADVGRMLAGSGFQPRRQWIDSEAQFALTLAVAA